MDKKEFIRSLWQENHDLYWAHANRGAMRNLQQTFPHSWVYITELLQNAVDEGATRIDCRVDGNFLAFEHSGHEFTPDDVRAICLRGVSRKGVGTIGFMGIGFKSVFRSFQGAAISSNGWRFRLRVGETKGGLGEVQRDWRESTLPMWDESLPDPSKGMCCRFVLSDRVAGLDSPETDLVRVMGEDQVLLVTLALKGVRELNWNGEKWSLSVKDHGQGSFGISRMTATATREDEHSEQRWLVLSSTYRPCVEASRRLLEHRQPVCDTEEERRKIYEDAKAERVVQAICPIDGKGVLLPPKNGSAYATLPVGLDLPFGVHIQADWLLSVSRTGLIDTGNNPWHDDIIKQVPNLLTEFLLWSIGEDPGRGGWNACYRVLPRDWEDPSQKWLLNPSFRTALHSTLEAARVLPGIDSSGDLHFIAPASAQLLPEAFGDLEQADGHYASLLGDNVASRRILTESGVTAFRGIGLINDLGPQHLATACDNGGVSRWLASFRTDERDEMLIRLLACLNKADKQANWMASSPACLPAETGAWVGRKSAVILPLEWEMTLAGEPRIQVILKPHVGSKDKLVSEDLTLLARTQSDDPTVQARRSNATDYMLTATKTEMPDIVNTWWRSLEGAAIDDNLKSDVIHFTCWLKSCRVWWKNRIAIRVLTREPEEVERLVPSGKALLAQPYAASFRSLFFPGMPLVSSDYVDLDPQHDTASGWRDFFEHIPAPPKGRFHLGLSASISDVDEYFQYLWIEGNPPALRKREGACQWRGRQLSNLTYGTLDAHMPDAWLAAVKQGKPVTELVEWMAEDASQFEQYRTQRIAYMPANKTSWEERSIHRRSAWCRQLEELRWLVSQDGRGPFVPSEVLMKPDPARPDAPVVQLPSPVSRVLDAAGIKFGTTVQQVTAVERLVLEGPVAADFRLRELVRGAIAECRSDYAKQKWLRQVLDAALVLPATTGQRTTHGRFVRTKARGDIGGWLSCVDHIEFGTDRRAILEDADAFLPFPDAATGRQAVAFLKDLWSAPPRVTSIGDALAQAFDLVEGDWESGVDAIWHTVAPISRVLLLPDDRWSEPSQGGLLYRDSSEFDELLDDLPSTVVDERSLGSTRQTQDFTARLLHIGKLSDQYTLDILYDSISQLPADISEHLGAICDVVARILRKRAADSPDEPTVTDLDCEDVVVVKNLRLVLKRRSAESGVEHIITKSVYGRKGQIFLTSKDPYEFAPSLAGLLLNRFSWLEPDRDLQASLALCLSQLGSPTGIEKSLNAMRKAFGLPVPVVQQTTALSVDAEEDQNTREQATESRPGTGGTVENGVAGGQSVGMMTPERRPEGSGSFTTRDRLRMVESGPRLRLPATAMPREEHPDPGADDVADKEYREAAAAYEGLFGRHAVLCPAMQPGYDIESYLDGKLCRRIEVKGKGVPWEGDEVVAVSRKQFDVASVLEPNAGYDYWVYVVCKEQGGYRVIPLRNPSKNIYYHDLAASAWRPRSEGEGLVKG